MIWCGRIAQLSTNDCTLARRPKDRVRSTLLALSTHVLRLAAVGIGSSRSRRNERCAVGARREPMGHARARASTTGTRCAAAARCPATRSSLMKNLSNRRAPRRLPSAPLGRRRAALPVLLVGATIGALTLHGCQDKQPTSALDASGTAPNFAAQPVATPIVNGTGKWAAPFAWGGTHPGVGIHLHVLPNGKVLTFGHSGIPAVW